MLVAADSYRIDAAPLATGAQGEVWGGTGPTDELVAIKIARPGARAAADLEREHATLCALERAGVQGVVRSLALIEVDGRPAVVMPRYPRQVSAWLRDVCRAPGPGTLAEILELIEQLARVLAAVHRAPIEGAHLVHRDVKPDNVYLDHRGEVVLGDFGGALHIGELCATELPVFGSWPWAPLDQLLPGVAMPDPTWDTFGAAMILFGALTGRRPAQQADPRPFLTPAGRALWELGHAVVTADPSSRPEAARQFQAARRSVRAAELVDPTGGASLGAADREALCEGVARLCGLARIPDAPARYLERSLWALLARALSPLAHPSPPNRYRDADELADAVDDLRRVVVATRRARPPAPRADLDLDLDATLDTPRPPPSVLRRARTPRWALGATLGLAGAIAAAVGAAGPSPRVEVAAPGGPLSLDRTEASAARWARCVAADACELRAMPGDPTLPVVGLTAANARTLCTWSGGRLPTEQEWRLAAGDGLYPWGETAPTCAHANGLGCDGALEPVGGRLDGAAPSGALDLAGNAWEWVSSAGGDPVLIGGGADSPRSELGARGRVEPDGPSAGAALALAGVRCAYDR